ncbi:MAG: hypothetical protein V4759_05640 [Pseudomonadota bacterium]
MDGTERSVSLGRLAPWGAAALFLALPAVAMVFTDELNWGPGDFVAFAAMLLCACGAWELALRLTGNPALRIVAGVAIGAVFGLVWLQLAVGLW